MEDLCSDTSQLTELLQGVVDHNEKEEIVFRHISKAEKLTPPLGDFPSDLDWFNTLEPLSNDRLQGKIVVLDFFTYCCINCLHVIPHLRQLEENFSVADGLIVIGVHSAKFANEKKSENILLALQRYNICHPVVNDKECYIWNKFGISCWPTLVILGPSGQPLFSFAGEGHRDELLFFVKVALKFYKKSISCHPLPIASCDRIITSTLLKFPGKISRWKNIFAVSDTGNHRIIVFDDSNHIQYKIGGKTPGFSDGSFETSRFNSPQGLVFYNSNEIYVADTENHAVRLINLQTLTVSTVVGNGQQGTDYEGGKLGRLQEISSPWDVCLVPCSDVEVITATRQFPSLEGPLPPPLVGLHSINNPSPPVLPPSPSLSSPSVPPPPPSLSSPSVPPPPPSLSSPSIPPPVAPPPPSFSSPSVPPSLPSLSSPSVPPPPPSFSSPSVPPPPPSLSSSSVPPPPPSLSSPSVPPSLPSLSSPSVPPPPPSLSSPSIPPPVAPPPPSFSSPSVPPSLPSLSSPSVPPPPPSFSSPSVPPPPPSLSSSSVPPPPPSFSSPSVPPPPPSLSSSSVPPLPPSLSSPSVPPSLPSLSSPSVPPPPPSLSSPSVPPPPPSFSSPSVPPPPPSLLPPVPPPSVLPPPPSSALPPSSQTDQSDNSNFSKVLLIAAAGTHQIWAYFIEKSVWWKGKSYEKNVCAAVAGNGKEQNRNNRYPMMASFAQPSGLTYAKELKSVFIADSESSSIRRLSLKDGSVSHVAGGSRSPDDLFSYGDVDGKAYDAKLQHPLGVVWSSKHNCLFVCDTYNHKVKKVSLESGFCSGLHEGGDQFSEPGGGCLNERGDLLYVCDTNNNCLKTVRLEDNRVKKLELKEKPFTVTETPLKDVWKAETCLSTAGGTLTLQIEFFPVEVHGKWRAQVDEARVEMASSKGKLTTNNVEFHFRILPSDDDDVLHLFFDLVLCGNETCSFKKLALEVLVRRKETADESAVCKLRKNLD